jgi:hypothetical protein
VLKALTLSVVHESTAGMPSEVQQKLMQIKATCDALLGLATCVPGCLGAAPHTTPPEVAEFIQQELVHQKGGLIKAGEMFAHYLRMKTDKPKHFTEKQQTQFGTKMAQALCKIQKGGSTGGIFYCDYVLKSKAMA